MTPVGRPREFDPDVALDHALLLFWRDGYEGASINRIADAMGLSKPSLYAAFGDKESLYLRALARYGERQRARFASVLDAEPDARTAVETFLRSMLDAHLDPDMPGGCMVVAGTTICDSPAVPQSIKLALHEALRSGAMAIEARLARAQRERQLPSSVDVAALATYFNTVLAGLSVQAKGNQCGEVLRAVIAAAMRAWPAPVRARGGSRRFAERP